MGFLLILTVVVLIFLNGATDASNAIAASVSSGALTMRRAAILSAVCNAAGGIAGGILFTEIRSAVTDSADFGTHAEIGVLASLGATVIFTFFAWLYRLPTSESHALLAASAGASILLGGHEHPALLLLPPLFWMTVCAAAGFLAGMLFGRTFPRSLPSRTVRRLQILCSAAASFLHGLQDLSKFLALLASAGASSHPALLLLTAAVMGLGTLCGGRRMTEAVGEELADLDARTALATDLGSAASLLLLSLAGLPASTTHARTASAAGGALVSPGCCLHKRQFRRFAAAWVLTFPLCAALAALLAEFLLAII